MSYSSIDVNTAKEKEMLNWKEIEVFSEVENTGQKTISLRWVVTEKLSSDNKPVVKARLVARGFEESMLEEQRRDSPTCTKDSLRMVLSVVASKGWKCNAIDIKSAFLQGKPIEREVFVKPPKEFQSGFIWKLNKNVYGLNDASRAWHFRMKDFLHSCGMKTCKVDPAVFYFMNDCQLAGVMCVHVDDIFWAGTAEFERRVISSIRKDFRVGSGNTGVFKYIGLQIEDRVDSHFFEPT